MYWMLTPFGIVINQGKFSVYYLHLFISKTQKFICFKRVPVVVFYCPTGCWNNAVR